MLSLASSSLCLSQTDEKCVYRQLLSETLYYKSEGDNVHYTDSFTCYLTNSEFYIRNIEFDNDKIVLQLQQLILLIYHYRVCQEYVNTFSIFLILFYLIFLILCICYFYSI